VTIGIRASAILVEGASATIGCYDRKRRSGCDFVDSEPPNFDGDAALLGRRDGGAVGGDLHLVASGGGGSVTRFLW
jgi:hypothetical protein